MILPIQTCARLVALGLLGSGLTNLLEDRMDASGLAVGRELFLRGHEYLHCTTEG